MPAALTDITEIATALGTLSPDLPSAVAAKPSRLLNVGDTAWTRLVAAFRAGEHVASFETAFANGLALLEATDGLRGRPPKLVEWKGPHRPPGDDVIPADIRIDHVYQVPRSISTCRMWRCQATFRWSSRCPLRVAKLHGPMRPSSRRTTGPWPGLGGARLRHLWSAP